jgi:hypothetical protein
MTAVGGTDTSESAQSLRDGATAAPIAGIVDLEQQVDMQLARPSVTAEASRTLPVALAQWSAAIWAAAEGAGPIELCDAEVSRGLRVAHRPLFVFGAHRSGTTLVRDLLDSHPALSVLPSEGTFFTNFERHLQRLAPGCWLRYLGCEWLRRLANPIHQQPYWLLGRSLHGTSPYVIFARALMAWWPWARQQVGPTASSWPLVAVALAYAHCTGGLTASSKLQWWVEKTPTNERFLDRLRAEFPKAKLVHVVRHPFAVYASHKQAAQNAGARFRSWSRVLRDLNSSYRIATAQSHGGPSEQYLLIRYEELLENTCSTMDRFAAFTRIEPLPSLTQPTAAGLPTASNSSFLMDAPAGRIHSAAHGNGAARLTRSERERIAATVGDAAAALGYDLTPIAPWRARLLRLGTRITGKFP